MSEHEHVWWHSGYQMQADPDLWLETCRFCPDSRLTSTPPFPPPAAPAALTEQETSAP